MKCHKCGKEMFYVREDVIRNGKIVTLKRKRKLYYCDNCGVYRYEEGG